MRKTFGFKLSVLLLLSGSGGIILPERPLESFWAVESWAISAQYEPHVNQTRTLEYVESSNGLEWPMWESGRSEIEMADINLDGNIDLVSIGDHGSPYVGTDEHGVMVYFGDGFGRWQVTMDGNFGYGGVAVGDANNDDLPDVGYGMHHNYASDDFGDQLIEVALGNGTGQGWTPWDDGLASQGESWGMFATDFGDVDNDGDLDIAATSFGGGNPLMIYLNNGDGTWTHASAHSGGNPDAVVFFGDINRDGNLDVAASYTDGSVFFGYGDGQFYDAEFNLPGGGLYGHNGLSLGDVDNDGGMDLAYIAGGVRVWVFDEIDSLWIDYSGNLPKTGSYEMSHLYDMNADGFCDVVAAGSGQVDVWAGDGMGSWSLVGSYINEHDPNSAFEAFRVGGDIDHNGFPDIVQLNEEGHWPNDINYLRAYKETSVPQDLTIMPLFPTGGEVLPGVSVRFTDWLSGVPIGGTSTVTVELSTSGRDGPWTTLGEALPNNGRLQWTVPTGLTSVNCYIHYTVHTVSDSVVAMTPRPFIISDGPREVQVALYPVDPPIVIPPTGGSFEYDVQATNNESDPQSFNGWTMVTLPNGVEWGPILGPISPTVPAGSVQRRMTQDVPASAPPGVYTYNAYVGIYPNDVWDSDSFAFTKSETGN